MRTDELLERGRRTSFIGDGSAYIEFTDQVWIDEINDRMQSVFSDSIISARDGYWLYTVVFSGNVVSGQLRYPARAAVGGLESVEVLTGSNSYQHLKRLSPREAAPYDTVTDTPFGYWSDQERVILVPKPSGNVTIRMRYYLRPSKIVTAQSVTGSVVPGSSGVDRGRITAVNTSTKVVTVNAVPVDFSTSTLISTGAIIDIVRPSGWFTAVVVSQSVSVTGTDITLAAATTDEILAVRVGDYVRVSDTTDWPPLPAEYHRMIADAAAANVLREMGLDEKAQQVSTVASADFARFAKMINPRVKSEPKRVRLRPYWAR